MVLALFMFIGIWWRGVLGVAIAHLATAVVLVLPKLYYSFAQSPINIKIFFQTTRPPLISGLVMMTVLITFTNLISISGVFQSICAGGLIGAVIYLTVLFLLPDGRKEMIAISRDLVASLHKKEPSVGEEKFDAA